MVADEKRLRHVVDEAMRTGELRLPPEPRLSEILGVSRGRVRTLLKRLEAEGLIWRHVGKGTFVGQRQLDPHSGTWAASISVDDVMSARLLLEPQLAAQAAIHATSADVEAMRQCMLEMTATTSFLQWKRLDDRLHRLVAEATHNPLLLVLYETMRAQLLASLELRMEKVFGALPGPKEATSHEHHAFIEAIAAHDPGGAETRMREHLASVRRTLFGLR